MRDVSEIVTALGGAAIVAPRFGLSIKAVEMWERRGGIPGRWHLPILMLAAEKEVPLSPSDLSEGVLVALAEGSEVRA
jgi:hypothetical protein